MLAELMGWMQAERRKLSRHSPVAKAMDYMLRRWDLFASSPDPSLTFTLSPCARLRTTWK